MNNGDPEPEEHQERESSTGASVLASIEWPWPKRYAITAQTGIIGYTDLERPVVMGQRAAGRLIPAGAYRDVRHVFELYRTAGGDKDGLRRYVHLRDQLGLAVSDGGTLPLAARVELIIEWTPEKVWVHVSIRDRRHWYGRYARFR